MNINASEKACVEQLTANQFVMAAALADADAFRMALGVGLALASAAAEQVTARVCTNEKHKKFRSASFTIQQVHAEAQTTWASTKLPNADGERKKVTFQSNNRALLSFEPEAAHYALLIMPLTLNKPFNLCVCARVY